MRLAWKGLSFLVRVTVLVAPWPARLFLFVATIITHKKTICKGILCFYTKIQLRQLVYCVILSMTRDSRKAVSQATCKGGEAVTTYETIALMLYFGMFVIALINAKK